VLAVLIGIILYVAIQMYELAQESQARLAAERRAKALAVQDPLTGLGNRRNLEDQMAKTAPNELRALLMVDLDDFKPINDLYGHVAGDQLLVEVARRLRAACRPRDVVCRMGGDEFAILTSAIGEPREAEAVARRVIAAFDAPFAIGPCDSHLGCSVGVSLFRQGEITAMDALRHADLALYRAKDQGGSTFRLFARRMADDLQRKLDLEHKLRQAIEDGRTVPYFQPIVALASNELLGFEALARWTDPDLGTVQPIEFIDLAERSGLITELSELLLRQAAEEATRWPAHLRLSFNLSPRQLKDRLVGLRILAILGETGLAAQRLEIDITEASMIQDKELTRELLANLRRAGVRIAIDDFGTGISSLLHLGDHAVDNLKIDGLLVAGVGEESGRAVVEAVLGLARGLGLRATAEGIESEAQAQRLIELGCQQGQGHYYGAAMKPEAVMELIAELSAQEKVS
jgi:diguanylate cyclase (GGDEF)-like protein